MKKINIYLFCSRAQIIHLLDYFVTQRGCLFNILCWHKDNVMPLCGEKYLTDTEYLLFFRESGVHLYGNYKTKKTYYVTHMNTIDKAIYKHPTVKPLEIIKNLIINSSKEGEIVLDPFIGSGTTAVACKELNRHYIGCEINKDYFSIAQQRLGQVVHNNELSKVNLF